jgi:hypothetical protein
VKDQDNIGFVTACHPGDKILVNGTLASIRHFCPGAPICLVADGGVDVKDLEEEYGLIVLRPETLPDLRMRSLCSGNYYAKMVPFWEGPFERAVWLDSDAILWGDVRSQIDESVDFQIFSCNGVSDLQKIPFWLTHYQHDPRLLEKFDPDFDWRRNAYFCSGAFAFRRGVISFERWQEVHSWRLKEPELFAWGEMGMLNYCIHASRQRGKIKVGVSDLQHLRNEQGISEYVAELAGAGFKFPKRINRPRIGHFSGEKPYVLNHRSYSHPFTIARLEHYRISRGQLGAWFAILGEESIILIAKLRRRISGLITRRGKAAAASA